MLHTKLSSVYDQRFFDGQSEDSLQSARAVARVVCQLFNPHSVVDVGCGLGSWLKAFIESGVERSCGIDGNYVNRDALLIPPGSFVSKDLTRPFEIPGSYDLAISVEVAEHLSEKAGAGLVRALCKVAPLVLFSAAVPGQGGSHHINEQWPSYWRSRFGAEGFNLFDPVRPVIRSDTSVRWWYRQNLLVFASPEGINAHPQLGPEVAAGVEMEWVYVAMAEKRHDLRATLRNMPGVPWAWSYLKPWLRSKRPTRSNHQTA
jgi:hypothetical protein